MVTLITLYPKCLRYAVLLLGALACQSGNALELKPGEHYRDLADHLRYLEDPGRKLDIESVVARRGRMQPLSGDRVDFGFSGSQYWLRLPVVNPADRPADWILSFNMRFMQHLRVFLVQDGTIRQLAQDGRTTPFADRDIAHRHLAVAFELGARDNAELYVVYWSSGTTAIPLSIENALSFRDLNAFHGAKNAAFYAFALFMLIYSALFWFITRRPSLLAYNVYLLTVVLYVLHMDGYTFEYLWPGWPWWNAYAALPLGLMLNLSAAWFSRRFLSTVRNHPKLDIGLRVIMGTTVALIASSALIDEALLKRLAFPYTLLCTLFFLSAGMVAYRKQTVGVRFYVVGWLGLTGAAILTTFTHFSAGLVAVGISFELIKLGVILDATMMGLALLDQYNAVRKTNDRLREREAQALRRQVELQERFLRLEERYGEAYRTAQSRGLQLASASHDLRQPLVAIRLALQRSTGDDTEGEHLQQTLNYLEQLVDRYMEVATGDAPDVPPQPVSLAEQFPIALLLENVERMFRADAAAGGLDLRIAKSSATVFADPLVVMRVLNNLVTNAIKYTHRGGVLIGSRRGDGHLRVCVLDTGPGMDAALLDSATAPYRRGSHGLSASGHGLGLAICRNLANAHGLNLRLASIPGKGTEASFEVPLASARAG